MQQKSLRMPLVVTGIGLQEQAEHNVSETESTTNFTEKHGEQFISLVCFLAYLYYVLYKKPAYPFKYTSLVFTNHPLYITDVIFYYFYTFDDV